MNLLIMWSSLSQAVFHVWLEHPSVWAELVVEVSNRRGADPSGPPADLPRKLLVRNARHGAGASPLCRR